MSTLPTLHGNKPDIVNLSISGSLELARDQWDLAAKNDIKDVVNIEIEVEIATVQFKRNKDGELIMNVTSKVVNPEAEVPEDEVKELPIGG